MQRFLLSTLVIFSGLFFFQCQPEQPLPQPHRFIAVLTDPSGTTAGKDWPMPDQLFFKLLADSLAANGGGMLYVYNLGYAIPAPCSLYVEPVVPNPGMYHENYDTIQASIRASKDRNKTNTAAFLVALDSFLFEYHPAPGDDYTYILPAVHSLSKTLTGVGMEYDSREVLLYTDMVHHEKGKSPERLNADRCRGLTATPGTTVYLCNYNSADTTGCNIPGFKMCGSYREFPQMLFSVRNSNKQPN